MAPSASVSIHSWDEAVGGTTHRFDHWEGCGSLNGSTDAALSFSATSDITCTAVFVSQVTVTLLTTGGGGTVTGNPGCTTSNAYHTTTCTVAPSTSVSIHSWDEAVGGTTRRFDHWEGCGSLNGSTDAALSFSATSDITCTAVFVPQVTVTLFTKGGGGTVTGNPGCTTSNAYHTTTCTVAPYTSVSIHSWDEPVGDQTFYFDHWENCGALSGGTNAAVALNPTVDTSCTAVFVVR